MKMKFAFKTLALCSLLAVVLTGCGGGTNNALIGGPVLIDMTTADSFSPVQAKVVAGQTVIWTNMDADFHTVTKDGAVGPNSDATHPNGLSRLQTFTYKVPDNAASGTSIFYHCRFHGDTGGGIVLGTGMAGELQVQ